MHKVQLAFVMVTVFLLTVAIPVWAQKDEEESGSMLEEVTVTAQKREQSSQDVQKPPLF